MKRKGLVEIKHRTLGIFAGYFKIFGGVALVVEKERDGYRQIGRSEREEREEKKRGRKRWRERERYGGIER